MRSISKIVKAASIGLSLPLFFAFPQYAHAATDFPCVAEVCIGDELDKLRGIDWQPVHYTSDRVKRIRKEDRARRAKTYPGFGNDGVPSFLIVGAFDKDLLDDLARVNVACSPNDVTGTYLTESGHKTQVDVSLLPVDDSENMVWRVTRIGRSYKGLEAASQRKQLLEDLNARYGKYISPKIGEPGALIVPAGREINLSLHWVDVTRKNKYGNHASCEKPKKITVD